MHVSRSPSSAESVSQVSALPLAEPGDVDADVGDGFVRVSHRSDEADANEDEGSHASGDGGGDSEEDPAVIGETVFETHDALKIVSVCSAITVSCAVMPPASCVDQDTVTFCHPTLMSGW